MVLRKIKQLLGLGSDESNSRSDHDVVVQEETDGPDTETEAAVKGTDSAESDGAEADREEPDEADSDEADEGAVDEPVAAGTDADASTESLVDEAEADDHAEVRAEPAEAAGPGADDEATDVDEVDPTEEAESPDVDTGDADAEGTPVDEIKGIGPAYSDRLAEIGINSVDQLAAADAGEIAERTSVAEGTVQKWIDRAQDHDE